MPLYMQIAMMDPQSLYHQIIPSCDGSVVSSPRVSVVVILKDDVIHLARDTILLCSSNMMTLDADLMQRDIWTQCKIIIIMFVLN